MQQSLNCVPSLGSQVVDNIHVCFLHFCPSLPHFCYSICQVVVIVCTSCVYKSLFQHENKEQPHNIWDAHITELVIGFVYSQNVGFKFKRR